jgi:superoxide reductase
MSKLGDFVKSADWNSEKHAPVIEAPAAVKAGDFVDVTASVGKAIAHPNTTEHHIGWIALHFLAEGAAATVEIGRCEFGAHGQDVKGPNEGPIHTDSLVSTRIKLTKGGTIFATSYCNIHGLWESSQSIAIEA